MGKQCSGCMEVYPDSHWAASRLNCPACGERLAAEEPSEDSRPGYQYYDSAAEIRFDLQDMLHPGQLREVRLVAYFGLGLMVLAFGVRLGFVFLGGLEGFWSVPVWFDVVVCLMLVLSAVMLVWSVRRLVRHGRAVRRDPPGGE